MPPTDDKIYDWKRFWYPADGRVWLDKDGFLEVHENPLLRRRLSDVVSFDEIDDKPCLLLLGEPGMGKSKVFEKLATRRKKDPNIVEKSLLFDLRFNRQPAEELFENETFKLWIQGGCYLRLFIDSLDECAQKDFALSLVGKLKGGPLESLRLRIACRTAELPPFLRSELGKLWSEKESEDIDDVTLVGSRTETEHVGMYELAPLRREDVEVAAGADAEAFLAEVKRLGAGPLASKPITLRFLLKQYEHRHELPSTRWDLYHEGCRILCEESSASRNSIATPRSGASRERLATAARIAAVCIFAQRTAIQHTARLGDHLNGAIHYDELKDGEERIDRTEARVEVTAALLRETIGTTLFNARIDERHVGFAHQTYAEFLAALFIYQRWIPLDKIKEVLAPGGMVIPTLREVAAWVASKNPEFQAWLLEHQPDVLLRSDMGLEATTKQQLVGCLLNRFERRDLIDLDVRDGFKNLKYDGLATQLEPVIKNKQSYFMTRRAAIMMVEACGLEMLQSALATVACDQEENYYLRTNAIRALVELQTKYVIDAAILMRLRPLAFGQGGDDPQDELKGYALQALWRKEALGARLSVRELFECLTPIQQEMHFGAYWMFLMTNPIGLLEDTELPQAIQWAAETEYAYGEQDALQDLSDEIVRRAWQSMRDPQIRNSLVGLAKRRFENHDRLFYRSHEKTAKILANDQWKKLFVQAFVEETAEGQREYMTFVQAGLLPKDDILWMLDRLDESHMPLLRHRWSTLLADAHGWLKNPSYEVVEALLAARDRHPELKEALGSYFLCYNLEDDAIQKIRRDWLMYAEEGRKREERRKAQPKSKPAAELIARLLQRIIDEGEARWFWQLPFVLWQDGETMTWNGSNADLTASPGWKRADAATRQRILRAARRYLFRRGSKPNHWLGKRVTYWPAVAGYLALWLLRKERTEWFDNMSERIWKRWAPIVISYRPELASNDDIAARGALVKRAYEKAARTCLDTMTVLLESEKRDEHSSDPSRVLEVCWDNEIGRYLLEKAKDPTMSPVLVGILLEQTLRHETPGAYEYAQKILSAPLPDDAERRTRIKATARAVFREAKDAGWPLLWPILCDTPEFGREIMLHVVDGVDPGATDTWDNVGEDNAATAFIWLEKQFPRKEESEDFTRAVRSWTSRDSMKWARNGLLKWLVKRGAVNAIERIQKALPEADWVAWELVEARRYRAQKEWDIPTPNQVIGFGHSSKNAQQ